MSDYIKREDAIKAICDSIPHSCNMEDCEFGCIATTLLPIPAADVVEQKHGQWLITDRYYDFMDGTELTIWKCSECGDEFSLEGGRPTKKYCSNCGADMRGES